MFHFEFYQFARLKLCFSIEGTVVDGHVFDCSAKYLPEGRLLAVGKIEYFERVRRVRKSTDGTIVPIVWAPTGNSS
jgi:hypothetical protein